MKKSINEIKMLALDEIDNAKSGHPGMALGSAAAMYTLFNHHLNNTYKDEKWLNRDRFALSSGHVSSLLYALLHLSGFNLTLDDLKAFRKIDSLTPGHPEYGLTSGVEATTGPLGQGVAMAVGMALAEKLLASRFNKDNFNIIDHYTYALCGDGDLQEGVSYEAISFAGNLNLNKLILFYDNNDVTLDGPLSNSSNEDTKKRFLACNWNVISLNEAEDIKEIDKAIKKAKKSTKPTLIMYKSIIGVGSFNQGTCLVHGSPLKEDDLKQLRKKLTNTNKRFYVSEETKDNFKNGIIKRSLRKYNKWKKLLKEYKNSYQKDYLELEKALNNKIDFKDLENYKCLLDKEISTRESSKNFLNILANNNKFIVGGSSDVAKSVMTNISNSTSISKDNFNGQNIDYGIREFAMCAISNGLSLHGGLKPFLGSFLVFADYMKPAIRLAAMMKLPLIMLFSHDSIAVGEDGPTHEPIEHLAMLRSIPNFSLIRPCNEVETKYAYELAFSSLKPTAIVLTRQKVKTTFLPNKEDFNKGAYYVKYDENAKYTIYATGSEVNLALEVYEKLRKENIFINVVSFPSWDNFERQPKKYKDYILKAKYENRISLEMLSTFGWSKYAKHNLGVDTFGTSGKASDVILKHEFDLNSIYKKVRDIIVR